MDMIGRGAVADNTGITKDGVRYRGNPDYVQLVGSRRLSTELGDLAESVNRAEKRPMSFDYAMDANGIPRTSIAAAITTSTRATAFRSFSSPPADTPITTR